jgi:hypothetical protein
MKAKLLFGIFSALLFTGSSINAQLADRRDFNNAGAGVVVNNYYDNYDYYFSSRINRFHRSYSAFDYYSPLYTDSYWYNFQPYTWGISIYGPVATDFGFVYNYPVYYYDYGFYNYRYDPWFGSSFYWGYDPFFYSGWYRPSLFAFSFGIGWNSYNWGWNRHNHGYNNYRSDYYSFNSHHNNSSDNYSSRGSTTRRRSDNVGTQSAGRASDREVRTVNNSRREAKVSGSATSTSQVRRSSAGSQARGSSSNVIINRSSGSQVRSSSSRTEVRSSSSSSEVRSSSSRSESRSSSSGSQARSSSSARSGSSISSSNSSRSNSGRR